MQAKIVPGYEGGVAVGDRKLFCVSGTGPKAYSQTNGDAVSIASNVYIDDILTGDRYTVSKTYWLRPVMSAVGTTRATWTFKWYVTATGAEVGVGVDLSAEQVQFTVLGGDF